jgi:hypothetical protein
MKKPNPPKGFNYDYWLRKVVERFEATEKARLRLGSFATKRGKKDVR